MNTSQRKKRERRQLNARKKQRRILFFDRNKNNYWCPIKIAKPIKVYLNRSICAVEISISKFQAPQIRKE
jgi:hypothetical protein